MTDVDIRLLSNDDLDGALALSSTAGWNQRAEDWRMLLELAPAGSFAAVADGQVVATAIGIDYGEFSWIAMMLVEPAWRGRGIGRGLLEAAMNAVPIDTPIRLDATPMGRALYQSYEFQDESRLTRLTGGGALHDLHPNEREDPALSTRPMAGADLPAIRECDRRVFGGDRHAVLAWALDLAPPYCYVARRGGHLAGYCLGRHGRLSDEIGPVVADSDRAARMLLAAAMRGASGRPVIIDSFDARAVFADWVQACGFQPQRPLFRMCRPPVREARVFRQEPSPLSEFTILGPEFA